MTSAQIWIAILGMAFVTYIPRLLPAMMLDRIHLGKRVEKFLKLIPYTAMTCLIVPGIVSVDSDKWYIGVAGGGVAAGLSLVKCPLIVCVLGAIATDFIIYFCIMGWF